MIFGGVPVITSLWMTEPKEMRVTLPAGGGWMKHVLRTVQVPRRDGMMVGGNLVVHPAMLPELRRAVNAGATPLEKGATESAQSLNSFTVTGSLPLRPGDRPA